MLYLQKYFYEFSKTFFSLKEEEAGYVDETFKCTDIFIFQ